MKISKKNKIIFLIGLATIVIITIVASYAAWLKSYQQTDANLVTAGCFTINFVETTNDFTLLNTLPLSDEDGKSLPDPYTFTIKNNCARTASVRINLEVMPVDAGNDPLDAQYIRVSLNTEVFQLAVENLVDTEIEGATSAYLLKVEQLAEGAQKSYDLRQWVYQNTPPEGQEKMFISKITVKPGT